MRVVNDIKNNFMQIKKWLLVIGIALFTVNVSVAQQTKKVYGPKAKNEKVWINKTKKSTVVTNQQERVTGGKAKNQKVWLNKKTSNDSVTVEGNGYRALKPLAKKRFNKK